MTISVPSNPVNTRRNFSPFVLTAVSSFSRRLARQWPRVENGWVSELRSSSRAVPYLLGVERFGCQTVAMLPSSDAALVFQRADTHCETVALAPHGSVVVLDEVVAAWSLSPNFVKALLGPPRSVLEVVWRASDHSALRLFAEASSDRAALPLLHDLRAALTITPDEHEFELLWHAYRLGSSPLPRADRRVQRLMLRFAGQSLSQIAAVDRLALTLRADRGSGRSNSLGLFADGSHYARASRAMTGHSPSHWRNVSFSFYGLSALQPYGGVEARQSLRKKG
jgi:hypothetical protein